MKKSGFVAAATVATASAAAAVSASTTSSSCTKIHFSCQDADAGKDEKSRPQELSSSSDKFAPRFDGLRFIETLITAHR